jgi:hypothetical protein
MLVTIDLEANLKETALQLRTEQVLLTKSVQTGASKAMTLAWRADEHVTEQGKKFQTLDNKLEAHVQLLEELQMKIILSHEEMQADIDACQKTSGAWAFYS